MQTAEAAQPPAATPPAERPARWLPLLGLLAVMAFVTVGGFFFSGSPTQTAFPGGAGEVETGPSIEVSQGVTIEPAEGWTSAGAVGDPPGVVLEGGNGRLLVGVPGGTGTAEELVSFYATNYLEPQASQLSVGELETRSFPAGISVSAAYVGVFEGVDVAIEGEIIAIIAPSGTGVVLDGWAPQGTYGPVADQVAAMAGSVVVP